MKLDKYLFENGLRPGAFAEKIGVSASTITRYLNGTRGISLETALLIEKETKGAVKCADLGEQSFSGSAA